MYYPIVLIALYLIPLVLMVINNKSKDKWLGFAYAVLLLVYLIDFVSPRRDAMIAAVIAIAIAFVFIFKSSKKTTILFFWLLFLAGYALVMHTHALLR